MEICLSLGSNLGDRLSNLKKARDLISSMRDSTFIEHSGVYETEPVGSAPAQHQHLQYLNAIIMIKSNLEIHELVKELFNIEEEIGRDRTKEPEKNSPRVIDIDIIAVGSLVLESRDLTIPHPRWKTRRFVVEPLAEIRPEIRIPGAGRTVAEILLALPKSPKVVLYKEEW
jgi:2-amino-4-hydroxy-6-hydroxymethyldihydropteridine diphosphokinase